MLHGNNPDGFYSDYCRGDSMRLDAADVCAKGLAATRGFAAALEHYAIKVKGVELNPRIDWSTIYHYYYHLDTLMQVVPMPSDPTRHVCLLLNKYLLSHESYLWLEKELDVHLKKSAVQWQVVLKCLK